VVVIPVLQIYNETVINMKPIETVEAVETVINMKPIETVEAVEEAI